MVKRMLSETLILSCSMRFSSILVTGQTTGSGALTLYKSAHMNVAHGEK